MGVNGIKNETYAPRSNATATDADISIADIYALVKNLNDIKNSVLLDTMVSQTDTKKKSKNTAFLHKLYTFIEYNGQQYVAKTTVEEYYNESTDDISQRAYNLKAIKIEPAGGQLGTSSSSSVPITDSVNSISGLFRFVKAYDKEFSPKPVQKMLLNEDGTPKVFCHVRVKNLTRDLMKHSPEAKLRIESRSHASDS